MLGTKMKQNYTFWCSCAVVIITIIHCTSGLDPTTTIFKTGPVMDAVRGSTFELRCDVSNRPDGISTRWERDSTNCSEGISTCKILIAQDRLPKDEQKYGLKFQAADTYFLIIKNVDENDEGNYDCQLPLTLYTKVYDTVRLRVVEAPSIDPLKTSSDMTVTLGEDVELTCAAYGRPKPLVKWTRAGNRMLPGGGYVRYSEKLLIKEIDFNGRGDYICTATNDLGDDDRIININMDFPPDVQAKNAGASQKIGYEIQLFCHVDASSNSRPVVTWTVGGDVVGSSNSDLYKVTDYTSAFSRVISKLTIYKVSPAEINTDIKCSARNALGTGSDVFRITESDTVQPIRGASSSSNHLLLTLSLLLFSAIAWIL